MSKSLQDVKTTRKGCDESTKVNSENETEAKKEVDDNKGTEDRRSTEDTKVIENGRGHCRQEVDRQ
jgi:hypothetical protein